MADITDMKSRFNKKIHKLKHSKGKNNQLFTRDEYYTFMNKVHVAKEKTTKKTPQDYHRLARYDIVQLGPVERMIVPAKTEGEPIKYYCYLEETFDIIHETHMSTGHGGRNKMMNELKVKYKNIITEFVVLYLTLCETCHKKWVARKKELGAKQDQVGSNESQSLCRVDLIDMHMRTDGDFKFIMVYLDEHTKFVILRPLKSDQTDEVAYHLLDIFTIFGAPCMLHSDNGREFVDRLIDEISQMWDEPKIVPGEPRDSTESVKQDIENMVAAWLETNQCTQWSEGLRFIQLIKNKSYDLDIDRSPYDAMFGCKPKACVR